jgi:hypothetical protein
MSNLAAAVAISVGAWVAIPGGAWSPSAGQVTDARHQLEPYVKQVAAERHLRLPEWSQYSFQYQGQVEKDTKVIFINAFCTAPPEYARREFVVVFDGGTCFFQAKYAPEKKQFLQVIFNGEA